MAKYKIIHTPFYYLTLVSLVIMLLLGAMLFGSILLARQLPSLFQEQIKLLAEMQPSASAEQIDEVVNYLKRHPDTQGESVQHISKDEALTIMEEAMGSQILLADMTNPFQDVVEFKMKGEEFTPEKVEGLRDAMKNKFAVAEVYYPQEVMGTAGSMITQLANFLLICFLGLLILVFVLIHQIMRLNILANRFMIKTMEIVGATRKFIIRPFIREAGKLAMMAGLISCGIFVAILYFSLKKYGEVEISVFFMNIALVCLLTFVLAFGISLISTWVAIEKQLGGSYEAAS